jgi:hypothetical protein
MRRLFALALVTACASRTAAPPRPAPLGASNGQGVATAPAADRAFPVPPHQRDPWTGDPRLPAVVRRVAQAMFDGGFADPRGCAYRDIELVVGDVRTGGARTVKTRGFVLPDQPFAIAWNGLVYPAAKLGGRADLAAEIAALAGAAPAAIPAPAEALLERDPGEAESVMPGASVDAVLLLARSGEGELAVKLWQTIGWQPDESLYDRFAAEWAWRAYDRAAAAHMRGAHRLAHESLRLIVGVQAALDQAAMARGVRKALAEQSFLRPVPSLLADEQRRLERGIRPGLAADALARMPPATRIATLIDHLDEVIVREAPDGEMHTGNIDPSTDPIAKALVEIGPEAVEPLIAVVATDRRLTRSMRWAEAARPRWPIDVAEVAYAAIAAILDTVRFPGPVYPSSDLAKDADALRAYWRRWKSAPVEERWFGDLADDDAGVDVWLEAATRITSQRGDTPGARGESLRGHRAPSVSDLFALRITSDAVQVWQASELAVMLSRWDVRAGAPRIDEQLARAIERTEAGYEYLDSIRMLTERGVATGHASVLDAYAAWLGTAAPPTKTTIFDAGIFAAMSAAPLRPSITRAAERLFRDGSPWVPLLVPEPPMREDLIRAPLIELLDGELIAVPAFNRHVRKMLADKRRIGELEIMEDGPSLDGIARSVDSLATPPLPPVGTKRAIRMADGYAAQIAKAHGDAPRFELVWPEDKRNAALVAMSAWVASRIAKR